MRIVTLLLLMGLASTGLSQDLYRSMPPGAIQLSVRSHENKAQHFL